MELCGNFQQQQWHPVVDRQHYKRNKIAYCNLLHCSCSCTLSTLSWEWWYIQRIAADVMVGFSEPYTVSMAFRTTSMAWKWLWFQYLTQKRTVIVTLCALSTDMQKYLLCNKNLKKNTEKRSKQHISFFFTCLCMQQPSCSQRIVLQVQNHLCLHDDTSQSEDHLEMRGNVRIPTQVIYDYTLSSMLTQRLSCHILTIGLQPFWQLWSCPVLSKVE